METTDQKTVCNARVQLRYEELTSQGKHGHYETMFRVVREEVEREREYCAKWLDYYDGPNLRRAEAIRNGDHDGF